MKAKPIVDGLCLIDPTHGKVIDLDGRGYCSHQTHDGPVGVPAKPTPAFTDKQQAWLDRAKSSAETGLAESA